MTTEQMEATAQQIAKDTGKTVEACRAMMRLATLDAMRVLGVAEAHIAAHMEQMFPGHTEAEFRAYVHRVNA
jgi:hypothetical protein